MKSLDVAVAQFEARDADKEHNLGKIQEFSRRASQEGSQLICFHECSISGYSFVQPFTKDQLLELAEPIEESPSIQRLLDISKQNRIAVGAGLFEAENDEVFNTYVVVTPEGRIETFRKIHAFVNPHLCPGESYKVFKFQGWQVGILICYDNNLPENVRMTALMGAEVIIMPHVTCGLPSVMPGRGKIDPQLWENRHTDPVPLRLEFEGPKGREWLMRWLPTRAYENGVYALFSNAVGVDYDTIKTGNSMVIDPYGEIQSECHQLGEDIAYATLTEDKIRLSSGQRYLKARKPELYQKLIEPLPKGQESKTEPGWKLETPEDL